MPDPLTHLVYGYSVGVLLSDRPQYHLLGMVTAVLIDAGAVVPGLSHHGWLHTPVFVLFVSLTLYGASRNRLLFLVPAISMGSHLMLDSLIGGIMWLWPVYTTHPTCLVTDFTAIGVTLRVFLLITPAYWLAERWRATGESPVDVLDWVYVYLPRPVAWGSMSTFGVMVVLVMGQRFLPLLTG